MPVVRMCPNCGSDEFDGSMCHKCGKGTRAGSERRPGSGKKLYGRRTLPEEKLLEIQERVLLGGRV
ncbi:MAG: hypothetical protein UY56_C0005G0006 [Parcubacteria group bacterium GW2011_GWA1_50_14]|uniref:Uncharacterized protein n=1 Tax=Candidatus Liptonbacteria bacterium GWB1_49_6 TaxID=1798644 RepID=A0A1G2C4T7_9BACT|nr:MAG: hypothetical protein UY56_C0005G0006 [Parcubacteria group bacterium GW2011_GWA1_50_14]OGY96388.1 MAG: hypothetical protein A2122_03070 [Candidatus Liptonbacteria bacterium GWB1_49_6]